MVTIVESAVVDGDERFSNVESSASGISWGAIVAGAVAAVAISFILIALGAALGFASISPWQNAGVSAATFGFGAAAWIMIVQWLSSAFGGYLTGRLRTKWAAMGTDEVFFRDTAHGFLAWALATVAVAFFAASLIGGGARVAATAASGAAQGGAELADAAMPGLLDTLYRPQAASGAADAATPAAPATGAPAEGTPSPAPAGTSAATATPPASAATPPATQQGGSDADVRAMTSRMISGALTSDLAAEDRTYLGQLVSQRTGATQEEAEARVDQAIASAKAAAESARQTAVAVSFITALSLLVGAFVAAVGGAIGGRNRDAL